MNVKIIRVLNTNAVVSVDSQGMELIMTGPGMGFKKRRVLFLSSPILGT